MKPRIGVLALGLSLAIAPGMSAAGIIGFLGNFDVINDTSKTAHGFEIELEGLHSSDITDVFGGPGRGFPTGRGFDPMTSVERYGSPIISDYTSGSVFGARVTYRGLWDGTSWDYGTPTGTFVTPGDNCWSGGGVGYGPGTPCDHFGVGTALNATKTTYSWLVEVDPILSPGVLTNGAVLLPAPTWSIVDAVPVGAPPGAPAVPHAIAEIQARPPENPALFGEAMWVKVYTTEVEDPVELEDLIAGQPPVELALGETEIEWQLLQRDPGDPNSGKLEAGYAAPIGPLAASVIRRYEFFEYSGPYKASDHEQDSRFGDSHPNNCDVADPAYDPLYCDPLAPAEIGYYLGAQNAAALLDGQAVVPEPGTSALLAAGLGLMGYLSRRRKVRAC